MARRVPASAVRRMVRYAGRDRRFDRPSTRVENWREPVDGRAPRLGPRQYIGHDIATGRGAWAKREAMRTPRWWGGSKWFALTGWALVSGATGWLSWRRHGGSDFIFGRDDHT